MSTPLLPSDKSSLFIPRKVISGGQTGVDRAALDVAIAIGLEQGGWCPKGRGAEDGQIPEHYSLIEMSTIDYKVRTEKNVLESDATLILYQRVLSGGTSLTKRLANDCGKPVLCLSINRDPVERIQDWLLNVQPNTLNVAGPRESKFPGINHRAMSILLRVFGEMG